MVTTPADLRHLLNSWVLHNPTRLALTAYLRDPETPRLTAFSEQDWHNFVSQALTTKTTPTIPQQDERVLETPENCD